MSVGLLDVNVLLALFDPHHIHHEPAQAWFAAEGQRGWATCPITENGFVRIASQPSYPSSPGDATVVRRLLAELCRSEHHRFWPDAVSLRDDHLFNPASLVPFGHHTDVYLLGLAVHQRGRFIAFDRRIPVSSVRGGRDALWVIDEPLFA